MLGVDNLHEVWRLVYAVKDQDRGMHQLAHAGTPLYRATDVGETFEELNMVQYGVAESLGGRGEVSPGIGEDVLKIR
jgi:hypothetical protein